MRTFLLSSWMLIGVMVMSAQTPPQSPPPAQPPRPAPAAPATPAPVRRPAQPTAAATARNGVALTVTDPQGSPLGGIRVTITGPTERSGTTDAAGTLRVTGLQVGTYRLRFSGDEVITFEREFAVRAGQIPALDVTLNAAPPPPELPAAPAPAAAEPVVGPVGKPSATSLLDYLSRNTIRSNEPRREVVISCSGNTRATLVQMNENQPQRLYDQADVTYYVVQGEGTLKVDVRETPIAVGSFISIPRGTGHELLRRGRRPLILVAEVTGEPCDEAK